MVTEGGDPDGSVNPHRNASVIYYDRNSSTGALTNRRDIEISRQMVTKLLSSGDRIAVSPDGNNIYVTEKKSLFYWKRDKETGTLSNQVSKNNICC